MKAKKSNKKIFISSNEDRGILIKPLKNKVSLSFWGADDDVPNKINFSHEDIQELGEYLLKLSSKPEEKRSMLPFLEEMNHKNTIFDPKEYK